MNRNILKAHRSHLKGKMAKFPFNHFRKISKQEIKEWEKRYGRNQNGNN